ncbi:LLM class flavin-dependent oxidoreductase [Labedaea rhizosphaerae]|uniref:Alkanesulfonate monooxygenase SsuD/methylene tetrahydromethanopterin reductase-like flavin-dependent oxidoreductase (Luciferase family) n=1 Tax=Labedaea rhizosphaerae TaxID=598644 RepID=A0A4R6RZW7_LABRH|nr:LLM class flavin-dependent oxidoreductase [Labedaea rhizosphaerae]TDP92197.1 alkanesulfonate monooxygenase SsuD/methylene tetrahydromethanopterin reductase-like flavin-dependent oxidoreductase (luciferase family) [Labedaea rhizosphaerae]
MISLGVSLPIFGGRAGSTIPQPAVLAKRIEDLGFDSVWCGDHLDNGAPLLDSTLSLTAAATATTKIDLCYGVLLIAMRQPALVARQLATLQYLSGNRVVLGVGVGGQWPAEWRAAGADLKGRGERTDRILRMLPDLLSGKETRVVTEPGEPTVTIAPAVPMPPVWVGGRSERAIKRTLEFGHGWIGSMLLPGQLRDLKDRFAELATDRDTPEVGTILFATGDPNGRDAAVDYFTRTYGLDRKLGAKLVLAGPADVLAERIAEYRDAGVTRVVLGSIGPDVLGNYEAFAGAGALLRG